MIDVQQPRQDSEPLVHKNHGDSFEATELERVLAEAGVGHLVVTGAETDAGIRSTIHGAFVRGHDVTLVADAHTTHDKTAWGAPPPDQVIAHTNRYWRHQSAPGRTGGGDGDEGGGVRRPVKLAHPHPVGVPHEDGGGTRRVDKPMEADVRLWNRCGPGVWGARPGHEASYGL